MLYKHPFIITQILSINFHLIKILSQLEFYREKERLWDKTKGQNAKLEGTATKDHMTASYQLHNNKQPY